jgi:hypothetical protein
LYCSPDITGLIKSRETKLAGHVARIWIVNAYRILARNLEEKRSLKRYNRKWDMVLNGSKRNLDGAASSCETIMKF